MRVWKYLVAMADMSIGLLGVFIIIFLVTKPSTDNTMIHEKESMIEKLKQEVNKLEIEISQAKSGISIDPTADHTIVTLDSDGILINDEKYGYNQQFPSRQAFASWLRTMPIHKDVLFTIKSDLSVNEMTKVIDIVKQIHPDVSVSITVMKKS